MARSNMKNKTYRTNAVVGNLAYDYDYLERQAERERMYEQERRAQREERRPEPQPRQEQRTAEKPVVRHRERQSVSAPLALGFIALASIAIMLLMSYAQLTAISAEVVDMQSRLTTLRAENVELLAEYERTFDLTAVKEAAQAAGMYKPSSSQVFYIDLSAPDAVEIYRQESSNVLSRVFTSFGQSVGNIMEYFR